MPRIPRSCNYPSCTSAAEFVLEYPGGSEYYCEPHCREVCAYDTTGVAPVPLYADSTVRLDRVDSFTVREHGRYVGCVADGYRDLLEAWLERHGIETVASVWCPVCEHAYPAERIRVFRSHIRGTDHLNCAVEGCLSRGFYPWRRSQPPRSVNPEYPDRPEPFGWYPLAPARCIAREANGSFCGLAARFIDAARGGTVCDRHRTRTDSLEVEV